MKKLIPIFILLFTFSVFGQSILNNQSVVEMVESGLSETIIIAKIRNSDSNFDTSNDALKLLVKNKVPENVIAAMIEKSGAQDRKAKEDAERDAKVEITLEAPENGQFSELADKTKVYFYTNDTKAREIMTREIKNYPRFEMVDSIDKAEFVLVYQITAVRTVNTLIGLFDQTAGDLYAVMLGSKDSQGKTRVRILYSTRKTRDVPAESNPAKTTMQKFIKDLKKLRNEK